MPRLRSDGQSASDIARKGALSPTERYLAFLSPTSERSQNSGSSEVIRENTPVLHCAFSWNMAIPDSGQSFL